MPERRARTPGKTPGKSARSPLPQQPPRWGSAPERGLELTLHTTDALSPELRHFRVGQGAVQGAARSLESVGGREAPPGSLAHAESDVGDRGVDRQARTSRSASPLPATVVTSHLRRRKAQAHLAAS
jgi:hypothetical protein